MRPPGLHPSSVEPAIRRRNACFALRVESGISSHAPVEHDPNACAFHFAVRNHLWAHRARPIAIVNIDGDHEPAFGWDAVERNFRTASAICNGCGDDCEVIRHGDVERLGDIFASAAFYRIGQ
jgi:hypothetical protein